MPRSVDPEAYPFPTPVPNYLLKVQAIMGFDTTNWRMAHDAVDIYAMSEPYNVTLDGSGLLTVHNCGSEENIRVGDSYVLRHQVYSLNGFSIQNCSDVELQGVQLFSIPGESLAKALVIQLLGTTAPSRLSSKLTSPAGDRDGFCELGARSRAKSALGCLGESCFAVGMGFYMGQVHNAHLKDCGVRRRPGRPMSITADASHFNECSGHLHLEGVHMEGQGDDGCNIHGMFHDVRDTGDGSTFELGSRPAGGISQMNIGGRYEFRNRNNWVRTVVASD